MEDSFFSEVTGRIPFGGLESKDPSSAVTLWLRVPSSWVHVTVVPPSTVSDAGL